MTTNTSRRLTALAEVAASAELGDLASGLRELAVECESDTELERQVTAALAGRAGASRRGGRRNPGPFNPFDVYAERGRDGLVTRLADCNVEKLKDIIAEHGMDRDRLAMKWKTPDRLISRIVETVEARASKGDAFRR